MSRILFRYVLRTYAQLFFGIFLAILAIFVVADFVDRAKVYAGEGWLWDVLVLYANKTLLAMQQLGPAALLLAAGAAVSTLRKQGEVTALNSLTLGPNALYVPVGLFALFVCVGAVAFDEWVVVKAARRVDEISAKRFKGGMGDFRQNLAPKQWFRQGDHIFYLQEGSEPGGFGATTLLTVSPEFQLLRRVDALSMRFLGENRWELLGVVERNFPKEGGTTVRARERAVYELGVKESAFRIRPGRPEQMRIKELREQIAARKEVGLSSQLFSLALHNRFAYPLAGLPAALLAVGLALRPNRRGHLTAAILEGLLVAVAMWGLMVVGRTLVLTGRWSPPVAAWTPACLLVLAAGFTWWMREGRSLVAHR